MSKLLSLKDWITLDEAATHLTGIFNENVSVADVYRFALNGHLVLSAHFVNHGRANLGRKRLIREAGFRVLSALKSDLKLPQVQVTADALSEFEAWLVENPEHALSSVTDEPKLYLLNGLQLSSHDCVQLDEQLSSIEGIWDLTMRGAERLDIEHALQQAVGGPSVELLVMDGVLLYRQDGTYARLLEHFGDTPEANEKKKAFRWDDPKAYYPAGGLPEDAPVVVRPQALNEFISNLSGVDQVDKQLDERERSSLLCIIGALAKMAQVDLSQPYKAAEQVAAALNQAAVPLAPRTIGTHLKAVSGALDKRTR